jgi:hypothetical protein
MHQIMSDDLDRFFGEALRGNPTSLRAEALPQYPGVEFRALPEGSIR